MALIVAAAVVALLVVTATAQAAVARARAAAVADAVALAGAAAGRDAAATVAARNGATLRAYRVAGAVVDIEVVVAGVVGVAAAERVVTWVPADGP